MKMFLKGIFNENVKCILIILFLVLKFSIIFIFIKEYLWRRDGLSFFQLNKRFRV